LPRWLIYTAFLAGASFGLAKPGLNLTSSVALKIEVSMKRPAPVAARKPVG